MLFRSKIGSLVEFFSHICEHEWTQWLDSTRKEFCTHTFLLLTFLLAEKFEVGLFGDIVQVTQRAKVLFSLTKGRTCSA